MNKVNEKLWYVNGNMFYELACLYDSRKSFYGKAIVEHQDNNTNSLYILHSYHTPVLMYDVRQNKCRIYSENHLTATTLRHVKEFLKQQKLPCGSKAELIKMYCNNGE